MGGTTGERIEERRISNKNAPPLPNPLLHFAEEREKIRLLDKFWYNLCQGVRKGPNTDVSAKRPCHTELKSRA
jgi:hypothetical protein